VPTCPRCSAPRILRPECPQCGVIYAKADALAARRATQQAAPPPPAEVMPPPEAPPLVDPAWLAPTPELRSDVLFERTPDLDADAEEAAYELKLYIFVLPVALLVSYLAVSGGTGFIVRLFTMPLHEVGHAVTAWLCGHVAFPTLWLTPIFGRSFLLAAAAAAGLGFWTWRSWKRRRWGQVAAGVGLLLLQFVGTVVISRTTAMMLFSFGGDGLMMVLGTLLMATLYAPPGSYLHEHGLRWGFVAIGATSYVDGFHTWWKARTDFAEIPFGQNEGVGMSDASRLVEEHGWDERALISRYVTLGVLCLVGLAVLYAVQIVRMRKRLAPKA
ncbi:hypothetical protein HPC49_23800, partial [Pyxidicoccus fallax]